MDAVIIKLLNMSITAVWLILAVVILRAVLKKAPKYINLILWALVGFRLICPFNFESMLSLIPSAETIPSNIQVSSSPAIDTGINAVNEIVNPAISDFAAMPYTIGYSPVDMVLKISFAVWLFGIGVMIIYSVISYLKLHRTVRASIRYNDNIYLCDNIKSPFILGIARPRIYLPSDITANQINPVIAHEKAHIRRLDHILKPLGFTVLSIHWFNPLVWVAYSLFCRDIEYACDEKVIKEMESEEKKTYSEALLSLSVTKRSIAACPLAFGETGVKSRIKSVLSYKKPALWIIIVSVVALVAVVIGFMTTPANESIDGYHYIDKYYYDEVIGEERANTEMRDIRYRLGTDMIITRFDGDGAGNATTLGTLVKGNANDHEIDLILATLPSAYSKNKIKDVYGANFYLSDKYVFIMFRNGDFIGAYLPTDSNGNYYVMNSFRLKREPDITIETVSEFSDLYIPGTTTNKDVSIGIIEMELKSSPYVVTKVTNNTGKTIVYGTPYSVFRHENGKKIYDFEFRLWTTPLFMSNEKTITRKLSLEGFDISKSGKYSVEFNFGVGEDADADEFTAVVEFYIEESVTGFDVPTSDPSVQPETPTASGEYTTTVAPGENPFFNATVLEVNERNILVEPLEGEDERRSASQIYVSTDVISTIPVPELQKGDEVRIVYNGEIQETYPAQISKVFAIYSLDE